MSRGYNDCGYRGATESYSTICSEEDTYVVETPYVVGISAYEIAVANGFEGNIEEWLESLKANVNITTDDAGKFLSNNGSVVLWDVSHAENVVFTPTLTIPSEDVQSAIEFLDDSKVDKVVGKQLSTEDYTTSEKDKLAGIETGAEVNPTDVEIKVAYESNPDTNAFTDTLLNKLDSIESGAEVNPDAAEVKSLYESNANTNAFSDSEQLKLSSLENYDDTDVRDLIDTKVDKEVGKGLSTNDYTDVEQSKLSSIEEEATKNNTDAYLLSRENHTGVQPISSIADLQSELDSKVDVVIGKQLSEEDFTSVLKDKLDGVEVNATSNQTDDYLLSRSNHTGTQAISTVVGLQNALDGKVDKVAGKQLSTEDYTTTEKNKLGGIEAGAQVNTVDSVAGKIGVVTLVKADVGLSNIDNTSDINKPISSATQSALDDKVDVVVGKQLSDENYTLVEKNKLGGVATGATANQTDVYLLSRVNHTGTQAASTITGLSDVATSNDYNDLDNLPTLGTAASTDSSAYATAAQGGLADSAVQPSDLAEVATSGEAGDVSIVDTGSYYTSSSVEGALQEIGAMLGDVGSALDGINGEVV